MNIFAYSHIPYLYQCHGNRFILSTITPLLWCARTVANAMCQYQQHFQDSLCNSQSLSLPRSPWLTLPPSPLSLTLSRAITHFLSRACSRDFILQWRNVNLAITDIADDSVRVCICVVVFIRARVQRCSVSFIDASIIVSPFKAWFMDSIRKFLTNQSKLASNMFSIVSPSTTCTRMVGDITLLLLLLLPLFTG